MAATRSGPTERTRTSERAAAIRRRHAREEARRRNLRVTLGVLAVLGIVVTAGFLVQASRDTTGQASTPPAGAVATYGVPFGKDTAPVTVTIYEDFMCPVCGDLEAATRDWLPRYAAQGKVRVIYRPWHFSTGCPTGPSTRLAPPTRTPWCWTRPAPRPQRPSTICSSTTSPRENTTGLSSDHLVDLAVQAGAAESVARAGIERGTYEQWVVNGTDDASRHGGVTGTPTVAVDGNRLPALIPVELARRLRESVDSALRG
jgi:protein-disulfide isomerase